MMYVIMMKGTMTRSKACGMMGGNKISITFRMSGEAEGKTNRQEEGGQQGAMDGMMMENNVNIMVKSMIAVAIAQK